MKIIVTGGAGFVGSNLIDALLQNPNIKVVAIDNLSTGHLEHLQQHASNERFSFIYYDLNKPIPPSVMSEVDCVVHLAALADIRYNMDNFADCLSKNIISTNNVIEACVNNKVKKILFASTCSVYGDVNIFPTKETDVKNQTSVYSSTKIASEKLLEGFANTFEFRAYSMRFVSMLGPRYSHGHVYDFTKKILNGESTLNILGNGEQLKSYLHISDAINAILKLIDYNSANNYEEFNIGHFESMKLKHSVETITKKLKFQGDIQYGQNNFGWAGDVSVIMPDVTKMKNHVNWFPQKTITESIEDTVEYLLNNPWLLSI